MSELKWEKMPYQHPIEGGYMPVAMWRAVVPGLEWQRHLQISVGKRAAKTLIPEVVSSAARLLGDVPVPPDWNLYYLSNGTCYLSSLGDVKWLAGKDENGEPIMLSPDALGLSATLSALSQQSSQIGSAKRFSRKLEVACKRLRRFVDHHPEGDRIRAVLRK